MVMYEDDLKSPEKLAVFVFSVFLPWEPVGEAIHRRDGRGPVECLRAILSLPVTDADIPEGAGDEYLEMTAQTRGYLKM